MKQILKFKRRSKQEEIHEITVKDHFTTWLKKKNRLADFEELRNKVIVSVDGEMLHKVVNDKTQLLLLSHAATMNIVIKPTQEIKFHPAVAGG